MQAAFDGPVQESVAFTSGKNLLKRAEAKSFKTF